MVVEQGPGGFEAVHPCFRCALPRSLEGALAPYEGKQAALGIRPEFISAEPVSGKPGKKAAYLCDTEIDFVEPQGSYSILITHIGEEEIKIVSSDPGEIRARTKVSLSVRDGQAMLFDPPSGRRIG